MYKTFAYNAKKLSLCDCGPNSTFFFDENIEIYPYCEQVQSISMNFS